jgi:hypothetical protein
MWGKYVRWTGLTCGPGDVGANQAEGRENGGKWNENTAKLEETQKFPLRSDNSIIKQKDFFHRGACSNLRMCHTN